MSGHQMPSWLLGGALCLVLAGSQAPRVNAHEFGAEHATGEFESYQGIGLYSGVAIPRGGLGVQYGPMIGAHIVNQFSTHWGLEIDLDYMDFNKNSRENLAPFPSHMTRMDFSMILAARFSPFYWKLASPLFIAGAGAHHWRASHVLLTPNAAGVLTPGEPKKGEGFMPSVLLGLGLTGRVVDWFIWDVSARWHLLPEPREFRKRLTTNPGQALSIAFLASLEI